VQVENGAEIVNARRASEKKRTVIDWPVSGLISIIVLNFAISR
jgi:hypothetical protein